MRARNQTACLIVCSMVFVAQGQTYSPVANLTEKWNDANSGWVKSGDGTLYYDGVDKNLAVKFGPVSPDSPTSTFAKPGALQAVSGSSDGRFVGDYIASEIESVSFDIMRVGLSDKARLAFTGANGNLWQYRFSLPSGISQWAHINIPFSPTAGWTGSGGTFQEAAQSVVELYVRVDRSGITEQEVVIDNFKVIGPWGGPMTNGVPQSWMQEYSLGDDQDPDHDGFKNYGEYLAGTDPNDKGSFFTVAISKGGDGTPALKWGRGNAKQFGVWRSSDLTAGFTKVQTGLTTNEVSVAGNDADSYFYLVEIEQ
jgi:hypothetical protein